MITRQEINRHSYPLDEEQESNLAVLLERINKVRSRYGKPMTVTSGIRSDADQKRINPKAPKSNHIRAAAVDIADANGDLKRWVKANVPFMEEVGLWMEAFESTPTWVHFQIFPPRSGNRFFKP